MKSGNGAQQIVHGLRSRAVDPLTVDDRDVRGDVVDSARDAVGRDHDRRDSCRLGNSARGLRAPLGGLEREFGGLAGNYGDNEKYRDGRRRNRAKQRTYSTSPAQSRRVSSRVSKGLAFIRRANGENGCAY